MHKRFRHLCLALAALIAAGTLLAALIPAAEAATYKKGSSGAVVSQIQTKLKNWGYYDGDVDRDLRQRDRTRRAHLSAQKRPHSRRESRCADT